MRLKFIGSLILLVLIWRVAGLGQQRQDKPPQNEPSTNAELDSWLAAYESGGGVVPPILVENPEKERAFHELNPGEVRHKGFVNLLVLVGESGRVEAVEVKDSKYPDLESRALEEARSLEFQPGQKDRVPVAAPVFLQVVFWEYRSQIIIEPINEGSVSPQMVDGLGMVYRPGNGVVGPKPTKSPDPEYSKEARKAKREGTVILSVVVDTDGKPRNIRVKRAVGSGLDEKAIEALNKWAFTPGMKDGHPVPVLINIEMNFRFY